jgi:hypothetical protein
MVPPDVQVVSDVRGGSRRLVVQIRSPRGAQRVSLTFHCASLEMLLINGVVPPRASLRHTSTLAEGWHRVTIRGALEATIELHLGRDEPVDGFISDYSFGLPPEGASLARARDSSLAVQSDDGDGVLLTRKVSL